LFGPNLLLDPRRRKARREASRRRCQLLDVPGPAGRAS